MPTVIAVANQKGGVGKTTSTINLASYLARDGHKVLLIDLDPQGNTTSGLGIDKSQLETTVYHSLYDPKYLRQSIVQTPYDGLMVLPSNQDLAAAELELANLENRERKLKALTDMMKFDYVLIDCPPSLSLLTINALTAADHLLIPVQAEFYALEGLGQLLQTMQRVKQGLNPDLNLLGVMLTMHDNRTSLSEQVAQQLDHHFKDKVFDTKIPRNVRLAESPSHGKPIAHHDRSSKGARSYKKAAKELHKRVKTHKIKVKEG